MNIYCPHCGKRNTIGANKCSSCNGDVNSLGVPVTTRASSYTPTVVITQPEPDSSQQLNTKSAYLARRQARKSPPIEDEDTHEGAPALIVTDTDDDDGVQHYDSSRFSGVLEYKAESTHEDAQKTRISVQLPPIASSAKQAPVKRGRPPGSKNKK